MRQLNECKSSGVQIVLDYTDHHLGFGLPANPSKLSALALAASCITPHRALAEALMTIQPVAGAVIG